jgi:hypothetical protein
MNCSKVITCFTSNFHAPRSSKIVCHATSTKIAGIILDEMGKILFLRDPPLLCDFQLQTLILHNSLNHFNILLYSTPSEMKRFHKEIMEICVTHEVPAGHFVARKGKYPCFDVIVSTVAVKIMDEPRCKCSNCTKMSLYPRDRLYIIGNICTPRQMTMFHCERG